MSSTSHSTCHIRQRSAASRLDRFTKLLGFLALAYRVYRERRALMGLSDETLKDLGLSRADTYREGARPWWDLPPGR